MLRLRVERSELTYEAVLTPPLDAIIDTPGRIVSALLSEFDELGVDLSDVTLEDEEVVCEPAWRYPWSLACGNKSGSGVTGRNM